MKEFYRVQTPRGFRIYRTRTFIPRFQIPKDLKFIQELFPHFRSGLKLFFNSSIQRYVVYREWKGYLVLISVLDGPGLKFRRPGEWVLREMRKGDILKGGSIHPRKAIQKFDEELEKPSEVEKKRNRDLKDIQEEMQKDWERYLCGRIGILNPGLSKIITQIPKKFDPSKVIGIDPKSGKRYRLRKKKHESHR